MIASMHDENNHITIPGFYDDVVESTAEERALMAKAPYDEAAYKSDLGVDELWGEKGYSTNERTGIRPTLEVNGIWGGYTGEGAKTVLPSKAFAKISARLVPNQSSEKITEKLIHAGRLLELQVLDHLIVTESSYYSFADEGKMIA
jgi:acetylornithine deacetylase/succinyl-diaminopimelate desuccinylase-like protein